MSNKKVDWTIIRQDFLSDKKVSLVDLAKRHKITYSSITKVSARENWLKEREEKWKTLTEEAIAEVDGDIKDFLKRHIKLAKFAQGKAVKKLVSIQDEELTEKGAITLLNTGLKAERELYPKQIQISGQMAVTDAGMSKELDEAIYESFRRKLGRKKPSIHHGVSQKTNSTK
jgi:hypothetical protein